MTIKMYSPEQDKHADVHPDEVANMNAFGWVEVNEPTDNEPETGAAEVLAMFDDQHVHFKTAQAAAKKLLGAGCPDTKDEIVDVLKAMESGSTAEKSVWVD